MEAGVTKALSCRDGRGQSASKSSRRSTNRTAVTGSDRGWSRCRGQSAADTDDVWSTESSRHHVGAGDKSRSRSTETRSTSRCRGCGGSESMEALDVRLLSPDSGAIVFSETPENELATTASTTPDCHNEVGVREIKHALVVIVS